jgi:hypothetical protein
MKYKLINIIVVNINIINKIPNFIGSRGDKKLDKEIKSS